MAGSAVDVVVRCHKGTEPCLGCRWFAAGENTVLETTGLVFLVVVLAVLILFFILIPSLLVKAPTIVAYTAGAEEDEEELAALLGVGAEPRAVVAGGRAQVAAQPLAAPLGRGRRCRHQCRRLCTGCQPRRRNRPQR